MCTCASASFRSFFSHFILQSVFGLFVRVYLTLSQTDNHTLNLSKFVPFSRYRRVSTTSTLSINDYMKTTTRVKFVCHIYATSQFTKTRKYTYFTYSYSTRIVWRTVVACNVCALIISRILMASRSVCVGMGDRQHRTYAIVLVCTAHSALHRMCLLTSNAMRCEQTKFYIFL